jgi:Tat protein translocase TatB subunit
MFGIGLPELIVIMVVALLVVGPSKLPELAKSLGRTFQEFRRMAEDVKETLEKETTDIETSSEERAGKKEDTGTLQEKAGLAEDNLDRGKGEGGI